MSVQAIAFVLENSDAEKIARLVMISIANHAKADGSHAWPSYDTMAKEAHCSRRQAVRVVEELEAKCLECRCPIGEPGCTDHPEAGYDGELIILRGEGKSGPNGRPTNLYHIAPMVTPGHHRRSADGDTASQADSDKTSPSTSSDGDTTSPPMVTSGPGDGDIAKQGNGDTHGTRTVPEPSEPKNSGAASRRDPVWDGFVDAIHAEPATRKEQSRWRGSAKEIRDALKTEWDLAITTRISTTEPLYARIRVEVRRRAQRYRQRFPNAPLTDAALANRWGELGERVEAPPLLTDAALDVPETRTPVTPEDEARSAIARVKALGQRPGAIDRLVKSWTPVTCPDCDTFLATAADAFEHPAHQLQEAASG